jgi:dTDP-4-amino-4,6-dideoxygalactose transaminase
MLTPHPTLRSSNVFARIKNDPRALCIRDTLHLTYNARGALHQLLRIIPEHKGNVVLLPAFHCTALVEPVAHSRFEAVFYRIKPDLSIDVDDLRAKLTSKVALIVAVHFFGFPTDLTALFELRERCGCYLLEDCAHSFLTLDAGHPIGTRGDFSIYSYYKTVPSLFGGGLRVNSRQLDVPPPYKTISLRDSAIIGKRLIEQMVENAEDGVLKRSFQYIETRRVARKRIARTGDESAPVSDFIDNPYLFREDFALAKMPALAKRIVMSADWQSIVTTRRRNYELLSATLKDNALLQRLSPNLPSDVCPWAYPVLLQDRTRFEHQLRSLDVPLFTFGEVLHPLLQRSDLSTRSDAENLSRQLLALPVHQNLSAQDVIHYAELINQFFTRMPAAPSHHVSAVAGTPGASV